MPIVENDPWRKQYFEGVPCPESVFIPTEDSDSYRLFPQHRWVFNKLFVAETQGLECGPHGIVPTIFPVFSKPIYNLRGMGMSTRVFHNLDEYIRRREPGHMWMTLLKGEHVSTDVAVIEGEPRWWSHSSGIPLAGATFDYWSMLAESRPELEAYCGDWIRARLRGYTGMLNIETLSGKIIEVHLRFSDQWPDLHGEGWIEAVVELYAHNRWTYANRDRRVGYSVVLHGPHGIRYRKPAPSFIEEILHRPRISSVQITFFEDQPPELHAMPPGGFRIAIVNCWDLDAGIQARRDLALEFRDNQEALPERTRTSASSR